QYHPAALWRDLAPERARARLGLDDAAVAWLDEGLRHEDQWVTWAGGTGNGGYWAMPLRGCTRSLYIPLIPAKAA
ncbi:MAG: hypothetical protein WB037_06040, partial [Pseudolabrys sp.]